MAIKSWKSLSPKEKAVRIDQAAARAVKGKQSRSVKRAIRDKAAVRAKSTRTSETAYERQFNPFGALRKNSDRDTNYVLRARMTAYSEKQASGCYNWTGTLDDRGRPRVKVNGVLCLAHRVAWQIRCGSVSQAKIIRTCENPLCVNTSHMVDQAKTRITVDNVRAIRKNKLKESQKEMAKRFKVSISTISNIINRKSWQYVPDKPSASEVAAAAIAKMRRAV